MSPMAKTPGTLVSSGIRSAARQRRANLILRHAFASEHEARPIEANAAIGKPRCGGVGADEQKYVADRFLGFGPVDRPAPAHPLQPIIRGAAHGDDLRVRQNFDVGRCGDAVDQIARHRLGQARRRAPASRLWRQIRPGRPPPGRRSCRRRPARSLHRGTCALRSAKPRTTGRGLRSRRDRAMLGRR